MNKNVVAGCAWVALGLAAGSAGAAEPVISVSAKNAQALVVSVGRNHPDISLIGLHSDVPGGRGNAIVACTDPARVGKLSSAHDASVIGQPFVSVARLPAKKLYEALLPVSDRSGRPIGMMVEQVPLTKASSEADALAKAIAARGEIEKGIVSKAWLFGSS